jgi:Asp-tRNA(Asn)/Glu-tRNA(Gln) amidotransferase A subunit family amidase
MTTVIWGSPGTKPSTEETGRLPETLVMPLAERARRIEAGELRPTEWREQAQRWSERADSRYRACVDLRAPNPDGPNLRVGVKDTVDVAGFATHLGLPHYRHHPRRTAAPLRAVPHAAINAKVVTTELNIGIGSGCRNPYFPGVDPAGSSTGAGVAVAANICDLALGTDVLGSVRWPAGRCGVVGLRTTHDPDRLAGVFPLSPAMDAAGWVARTAADLMFCWDHLGLGILPPRRPCRVGVVREVFTAPVGDAVAAGVDKACEALRDTGHEISEVELGSLWECRGTAWEMCARDAWTGYRAWGSQLANDLLESTWSALESGARVSDADYRAACARMAVERARVADRFATEGVDAWLLPLDPTAPSLAGTAAAATSTIPDPRAPDYDREVGFTPVASFAGIPAVTVPVSAGTVPIAMQLLGPNRAEGTLLRLAEDIATAVGDLDLRLR